ncbi:MAG TPA: alkaline phosphatase family protein [Opitutaceae bacterium]|nr:alkaline phosphatase family protein [Opitutaceae bacterium]
MPLSDIKHVFVLMLENRSYDHILGSIAISGADPTGAPATADGVPPGGATNLDSAGVAYAASPTAPFVMPADPPHEYDDVRRQLLGANGPTDNYDTTAITNSGFVLSYETVAGNNPRGAIMSSFAPGALPYLSQLAQQFCTCDRWFSSLPGPTVPNRFFLLAGSSNGSPKSPSEFSMIRGELGAQFTFKNGTIFKRIKEQTQRRFVIYRGDDFPLSGLVDGVARSDTKLFDRAGFARDCSAAGLPDFIFIEPSYGVFSSYRTGNSMHPVGDVRAGDQLIKDVYEGIRGSACWTQSVLVLIYDEHGGFFDHVVPLGGVPAPGDVPPLYHFDFTQLGLRVPAVVISPLIPARTIDHTCYDHTSVLATLRALFPEIGWFTERDRLANDLSHLFTLSPATARTDAPLTLAAPAGSAPMAVAPAAMAAAVDDDAEPPGHAEAAFVQVAAHWHARIGKAKPAALRKRVAAVHTKGNARDYLREVSALLRQKEARKAPAAARRRKRKRAKAGA